MAITVRQSKMMEKDNKSKKALVITGGDFNEKVLKKMPPLTDYFLVIAADKGFVYAGAAGVEVDVIVGDFDSCGEKALLDMQGKNVEKLPREKDFTDTEFAIRTAIGKGASSIDIIGGFGSRIDHMATTFASAAKYSLKGLKVAMYDLKNKVTFLNEDNFCYTVSKAGQYGDFVSVVPLSCEVTLTMEGFKYPLNNFKVPFGSTLCQSNEIEDEFATITLHSGLAAVFESED